MNLVFPSRWSIQITLIGLLAGCASPPMTLPGPISYERTPPEQGGALIDPIGSQTPTSTLVTPLPSAPVTAVGNAGAARRPAPAAAGAEEEMVSMALEQTPLPLFIQILYGNVLKQPYSMDTAINSRTDLVTFKTSAPIPRSRLAQLGVALLRSYGLAVQEFDGLVRIVPENAPSAAPSPILRLGRTMPETPEALRTAFQYVELDVVRSSDINQWLRQVLGNRVQIFEDGNRNSFLLSGTQSDLRNALELIRILDQPRMRGNVARRITPAYMPAQEFASRLVEVLSAQGYSVSTGATSNTPILLIPIPTIGAVMAFASSEQVMDQVLRWAAELDTPVAVKTQNGLYTYPVQYADAEALARTLGEIMTGLPAAAPAPAAGAGAAAAQTPTPVRGSRVVVNSATNTLIFRGTTADEYQQIMALMRELDRPVKSAMIEVVVAELKLGGSQQLGIEWNVPAQSINSGQNQITGGTQGRLGIGSSGFTLSVGNRAGTLLAQLNTLASNNQARILSNPKVLARNGETASIQVGSEVPVVTSQQSGTTGGLFNNTGVLQQISYRSTGVILRVRPVINSGNRLDLDVSQEVSSAAETRTGVSASPTIATRRIETKLSLRDGSTVLLGGLISRNSSDANTGIPYLKDIPGLGALFRTESSSSDQTELLIMITPYVVSDDFESESITEAIQRSFGSWAQDIQRSRVMQQPPVRPLEPVQPPPGAPVPQRSPLSDRALPPPPPRPQPQTAPSPVPAAPAPVPAPAPASPAAPQPKPADDGVTMSKPASPAPADKAGATADKPADKQTDKPASLKSPLFPPGSREVEDEKIKREIEQLLKGK